MKTLSRRLLPHTALVTAYDGGGAYGPVYLEPVRVRCRVDFKNEVVVNERGAEVVSKARIYFPAGTSCPPQSKIVARGQDFTVLTYSPVVGARDEHHVMVTTTA